MMTETQLTDALERDLVARRTNRISQPLDLRRFAHTWGGRARRALRGG
jgi:hypothetical protein